MKKAYEINWNTNTFTMTKKFAEEANTYGTAAYNMLMDVRSMGFNIAVRETEKRKACSTRVTFKQMENYISCLTDADERLEELHAVMNAAKGQKNQYEYVRKWYLANYPHFNEIPVMDTNSRIVAPRIQLLAENDKEMKISA